MSNIIELMTLPLSFPFMQRALLTAIVSGSVCAILSCYLVLKGWSLMGDAISHAVLPGVVLAYIAGAPLVVGAFASGLCCAIATGYIRDNCRIKEDTVMGIVFSGMFAIGLVIFSRIESDQHLSHILFGNVLGVTPAEFWQCVAISTVVILVMLVKRKDMLLYCFDPAQARVIGLRVKWLHYGLLSMLALTIVAALQAIGIVLVIAMLITPGITAFMLCRRFSAMLICAVLSAALSAFTGTLASFWLDAATGPCIVLIQSMLFLLAWLLVSIRTAGKKTPPAQA
ncbi:metal ABC transporter permease [Pantoea sp. B65]|uniref:metal ABC transporter permease n=1 Tax=Pantoea sp. B65 TaxID=2813359 RepID=UPI0039B6A6E3